MIAYFLSSSALNHVGKRGIGAGTVHGELTSGPVLTMLGSFGTAGILFLIMFFKYRDAKDQCSCMVLWWLTIALLVAGGCGAVLWALDTRFDVKPMDD